jgi:hypothetical protein
MINKPVAPRRLAVVLGLIAFAGCQTSPVASVESAQHASNADPNTAIYIVRGSAGGGLFDDVYLLATNHRGYRLDCATSERLFTMVRGAGFDLAVLSQPRLSLNDPAIEALAGHPAPTEADFKALPCGIAMQARLFYVDFPAGASGGIERKYFVELPDEWDLAGC